MRRLVGVLLLVVIGLGLVAGAVLVEGYIRVRPPEVSYSDAGLTCGFYPNTPAYIETLVPEVIQTPQFQTYARANPFVWASFDNITNRVQGNSETTEQLPPVVELGFLSLGKVTSCTNVQTSNATLTLTVQVPVEGGAFNLTGVTFNLMSGHF
jgi:hypothetical protein